jgi:hypothetical protein
MAEPVQQPIDPQPTDLQFRRAVPIADEASIRQCSACKNPIQSAYYHAAGQTVCPDCAKRIQDGQQAPPAASFGKAFLYGSGAAFAGFAIYSVARIVHMQTALIAILIGYMVGKAIRHASHGLGGRPQQILAIALTYFAITTSFIPPALVALSQKSQVQMSGHRSAGQAAGKNASPLVLGVTAVILIPVALASPFLSLGHGFGGIFTLLIIFFGMGQAWRLTGRTDILVMGPYESAPGSV